MLSLESIRTLDDEQIGQQASSIMELPFRGEGFQTHLSAGDEPLSRLFTSSLISIKLIKS